MAEISKDGPKEGAHTELRKQKRDGERKPDTTVAKRSKLAEQAKKTQSAEDDRLDDLFNDMPV